MVDSGEVFEVVICEVDLSEEAVTMPATLLSQLTPGAVMAPNLAVAISAKEVFERDGWQLSFSALSHALRENGGGYVHEVTLK